MTTSGLHEGQLDNDDLETLIMAIAERESWQDEKKRIVIEVGTGGGRGSTVAIHRGLTAGSYGFQLIGYEGDAELAMLASQYWRGIENVQVVNEYFMHRDDIDLAVRPHVKPNDRDSYLPRFDAVATAENFLESAPPGPIDLLFIDSVRYTHLAILRAAAPWLRGDTVVIMEDDIPGYGEFTTVKSEFRLREVAAHEIRGQWPIVEFRIDL